MLFAALAFTRYAVPALIGLVACLGLSVWINRGLYAWFARKRGLAFTARAVPLHIVYQLVSAVAVPVGVVLYVAESWLPSSRDAEAGGSPFGDLPPSQAARLAPALFHS